MAMAFVGIKNVAKLVYIQMSSISRTDAVLFQIGNTRPRARKPAGTTKIVIVGM